ncbi:MAG: hypothetical protein AVDCRST_MAG64-3464, partial [uncultured Phycisphaerae bacterium]
MIVGGAFSGAATALLLRRERPALRVLVVEKRDAFDAKVGEATTEMSAMFLTRRLALWQHLELEHLPKEGLRYWSANDRVTGHADASETGGFLRSTVPAFQLRRDVLDEHVLKLAVAEGAELVRPARVRNVELKPFDNTVTIATAPYDDSEAGGGAAATGTAGAAEQVRTVRCRWLLDASGRACFLGKHLKLIDWNDAHPIASIWARWDNVRHIDDLAARAGDGLATRNVGSRRLATNHYIGHGYWVWVIPLGHGQTSVGVVFDKRIHQLHEARDRLSAYTGFLRQHPALAELLEGATPDAKDLRGLSRVAYASRQYMGDGWALVGDAAAFIDPYYSPGLDHAAFTVEATTDIIAAQARGERPARTADRVATHNGLFTRSYRWFFGSVYRDKYYLFGEHDLTSASFLIDTAFYYIFSIIPAYRVEKRFRSEPVMGPRPAYGFYLLLTFMKWRFRRIADLRQRAGEAGARNHP